MTKTNVVLLDFRSDADLGRELYGVLSSDEVAGSQIQGGRAVVYQTIDASTFIHSGPRGFSVDNTSGVIFLIISKSQIEAVGRSIISAPVPTTLLSRSTVARFPAS